jgi:carboxylesterase
MNGAEPFALGPKRGRDGVLLVHGFTSTPDSLREFGTFLAKKGYRVVGPLLSGHGTTWEEMSRTPWTAWRKDVERAYQDLRKKCRRVFCAGLSMGATLCLDLASRHPEIAGLSLVNNALIFTDIRIPLAGLLKWVLPSTPAIASDLKDTDAKELAYARTPTASVEELLKLTNAVRRELSKVHQPAIIFKSKEDHVIPRVSATYTYGHIGSAKKELVWLEHSYHVATMDFDREEIFEKSTEWFRKV